MTEVFGEYLSEFFKRQIVLDAVAEGTGRGKVVIVVSTAFAKRNNVIYVPIPDGRNSHAVIIKNICVRRQRSPTIETFTTCLCQNSSHLLPTKRISFGTHNTSSMLICAISKEATVGMATACSAAFAILALAISK